jgi:hypothetical protein
LHDEIFTKIIFLRVTRPIRLRFPAPILGMLIKEAAIQAAMQVITTIGASILAPDRILPLHSFSAGIAKNHDSLYTQRENKLRVRSFGEFKRSGPEFPSLEPPDSRLERIMPASRSSRSDHPPGRFPAKRPGRGFHPPGPNLSPCEPSLFAPRGPEFLFPVILWPEDIFAAGS